MNVLSCVAVLAVFFFALVPMLLLLGESRRLYLKTYGALLSVAVIASLWLPRLTTPLPDFFLLSAFLSAAVLLLGVSVWRASETEVRFNARSAALLVGGVCLLSLPLILRSVVDGDEPFYLMETESLAHDHDLDLRNQYADSNSATGRVDLRPQDGDPVGLHGELYSRHEPLLALLLIPGFLAGGRIGAIATMLLFGILLASSLTQLLLESGRSKRTTLLAILGTSLASPVLFYSLRVWPEVPAALCLTESLRAYRDERPVRFFTAVAFLAMLKLRFLAIAVPLVALFLRKAGLRRGALAAAIVVVAVPLLTLLWISGSVLNVHSASEFRLASGAAYVNGLLGLLIDSQNGLLFAAPLFFFALLAGSRGMDWPRSLRIASFAALPYLLLLLPRAEWHGGWSPPVRYLIVFAPLFALFLADAIDRFLHPVLLLLAAIGSSLLMLHGLAWPWRLFHLENGESILTEGLSGAAHADYSRLLPSLVRVNTAAAVAALLLVFLVVIASRGRGLFGSTAPVVVTAALLALFVLGPRPGGIVELEDSHVIHRGGELSPHEWTVARFLYVGGWRLHAGQVVGFRVAPGTATLRYSSPLGCIVDVDGQAIKLTATPAWERQALRLSPRHGFSTVRMLQGTAVLDQVAHE